MNNSLDHTLPARAGDPASVLCDYLVYHFDIAESVACDVVEEVLKGKVPFIEFTSPEVNPRNAVRVGAVNTTPIFSGDES